eukprot:m.130997 g.130997  ORF g.130997 m.130997 type:complete len:264 (+) comp29515_c0_seq5:311-1102(+)
MSENQSGVEAATCDMASETGWGLQLLVGLLAFTTLVVKRQWETPRRPWKVWFFDSSKQGFVAVEIHFINVLLAESMNNHDSCTWYFTLSILDSTFGLLTVYWLLRALSWLVAKYRLRHLNSGEYGTPPRVKPWLYQMFAYNLVMLIEKGLCSLLLLIPAVQMTGNAILRPAAKLSQTFEYVLALLITPFAISALWFWVVDGFIKKAEMYHANGFSKREADQSPDSEFLGDRLIDDGIDSSEEEVILMSSPMHTLSHRVSDIQA